VRRDPRTLSAAPPLEACGARREEGPPIAMPSTRALRQAVARPGSDPDA
jgi:hypothetical protein